MSSRRSNYDLSAATPAPISGNQRSVSSSLDRALQEAVAWDYYVPFIMDFIPTTTSHEQPSHARSGTAGAEAGVPPVQRRYTITPLTLTGFPIADNDPPFFNDITPQGTRTAPTSSGHAQRSPIRFPGWNFDFPVQEPSSSSSSKLSRYDQENALRKLKKQVYCRKPKAYLRRLGLYYRDMARPRENSGAELDEDSDRCAVCLDDFEPGTEVMVTPCNHMFHEDCIVPWVKSNGRCPVCRFVFV